MASVSATVSPARISSWNRCSDSGDSTTAISVNSAASSGSSDAISSGSGRMTWRAGTVRSACSTLTPIGHTSANPSTRAPNSRASPRARYPP